MRKVAKVSELKARLSGYLEQVKGGEEVVITERGTPVAKLVPLPPAEEPEERRLRRLEREGLVTMSRKRLPRAFWKRPRPRDPKGLVLAALLDERASGR